METEPARNPELEVPLGETVPAIRGLVRALAETGLGADAIDAVVRHRVIAECVGCGITLAGNELSHLAIDRDAPPDEPAKLNRVRLGYCARSSCDSRYYRLRVTAPGDLDWPALLTRALETGKQESVSPRGIEEPEPAEADRPPAPSTRRRRLLLAGLAVLASGALWHFWDDLPFAAEKPPKYRINPNSLQQH